MITNNNDNITNKAQNRTQKHKHKNTVIKKEQNRTQAKDTKISSAVQYNENAISEVNV